MRVPNQRCRVCCRTDKLESIVFDAVIALAENIPDQPGLCAGLFAALKCPVFNSLHYWTVGNLKPLERIETSTISTRIPICSPGRLTLTLI
jgi:hypothetical protein